MTGFADRTAGFLTLKRNIAAGTAATTSFDIGSPGVVHQVIAARITNDQGATYAVDPANYYDFEIRSGNNTTDAFALTTLNATKVLGTTNTITAATSALVAETPVSMTKIPNPTVQVPAGHANTKGTASTVWTLVATKVATGANLPALIVEIDYMPNSYEN